MKKHALVLICAILLLIPLLTTTASADVDEFSRRCDYSCYYYGWNEATQNYDILIYSQNITNGPYPITVGFYQYRLDFADWTYDASNSKYVDMFKASEGWGTTRGMQCWYFYKPAPHLVNYKITGNYLRNDSYQTQSYTKNTAVSVLSNPVVAGYDFSGWTSGNVTIQNGAFTMPSGDVLITGSFTPRTDTPYSVQFLQQDAESNSYTQKAADTISGKGTTDTSIKNTLDVSALALKYPGFHLSDASQSDSTVIGGNGTSVLKLYYDRNTANVNYSFAGKTPLADPTVPATVSHRLDSTVSIAEIPTLAGYDFSGWSSEDLDISSGSFTMPDNDVTVTGAWIPHTDTPFTVEFYQQNIEDNGYTKLDADTFDRQGTTDTLMRDALDMPALALKYPGFHLSDASQSDSTVIGGNGLSVLKLYYDRNTPNVIYSFAGKTPLADPTVPATVSHRLDSTVSIAEIPTLAGYDFSGWSSEDLDISSGSFTMPDNDVTITGAWIPHTDTPFAVEVYQQNIEDDGYTKADTFSGVGTTDTQIVQDTFGVSVLNARYPGFHLTDDLSANATTINGDGSTVLKLYYDRNTADVSYTYNYTPKNAPELPVKAVIRFGTTVAVAEAPSLVGYDFSGWVSNQADLSGGTFSMPDNVVVITGDWTPLSEPYQVEYYLQELDGSYTLTDTENCTGLTDTQALAPAKGYTGFAETQASKEAEANTTVNGDGSTVLKLYFDRNIYTVSYAYQGDTDTIPPELPAAATYRYGETVTVSSVEPSLQGYDFGGWKTQGSEITDGTFTMPAKDVAITGAWYPKDGISFQIMYYQQNLVDDDFTLVDTVDGKGITGSVIPKIHREYEGFIETSESLLAEETKIASNGSTVVKLYFDRNTYTVSYAYQGDTDTTPPELPAAATYRYGEMVTVSSAEPLLQGYDFGGWGMQNAEIIDGAFALPAKDVTLTGTWYPRNGIPFQIMYYQQNLNDDDFTLVDTVKGEGFTGSVIPNIHRKYEGFLETPESLLAEETKIASNGSTVIQLYFNRGRYTVSYEYSGGDAVPADAPAFPATQTCKYGQTVTLPVTPTTKESGKVFSGWTVNGTAVSEAAFLMPRTDAIVTGVWHISQTGGSISEVKKSIIPVSFVSDGSTVGTKSVESGATLSEPTTPTKTGYTFDGWYADSNCTEPWDFETGTVTVSMVLYAKWVPGQYMVRFHCSGGSDVPTQTLAYGGLVAQPTAPARTGYTFTGWYADSALSKAWSFATDTVQDDMTLYAKWEPVTCTVSFNVNGGSDVPTQTVTYGGLAARPTTPARTGYTFAGWYADSPLSKAWSFSEDTVLINTTLYAKWVAAALPVSSESGDSNSGDSTSSDNLTVTFDSAGGSTISAQLVRYGQLLEKPSVNPEKAGYTFAGWFTDPDYTHAWSFPATVSQNTMLYAKWIEVEKPVSAAFPVEEQATDVAEAPLQDSFRINNRMILAAVAALCLLAFFTLLVIWSKRVKFYCMDGDGAYRTLCHGVIRHGSIDITSAYQAANEGTVMVRISRFYALVHLKGQISIRLKGHTLMTDQLSLNNKYVIGET